MSEDLTDAMKSCWLINAHTQDMILDQFKAMQRTTSVTSMEVNVFRALIMLQDLLEPARFCAPLSNVVTQATSWAKGGFLRAADITTVH